MWYGAGSISRNFVKLDQLQIISHRSCHLQVNAGGWFQCIMKKKGLDYVLVLMLLTQK